LKEATEQEKYHKKKKQKLSKNKKGEKATSSNPISQTELINIGCFFAADNRTVLIDPQRHHWSLAGSEICMFNSWPNKEVIQPEVGVRQKHVEYRRITIIHT